MRALGRCGSEATVHVGREPKAELVTAKCYGGDATRTHEHGQRGALFERSAEAAGKAEGGEEAYAGVWEREHPAGGFHCCVEDGG